MAKRIAKKPKDEAPQNGTARLMKELWQAAVNLRGSIEPADYKRYVLPIIFLRFLSLRYERRLEELEGLLADPKSDYFTKDAKARARNLADADEYRAAGAFIVPEKSRWSYIIQHDPAGTIRSISSVRQPTLATQLFAALAERPIPAS